MVLRLKRRIEQLKQEIKVSQAQTPMLYPIRGAKGNREFFIYLTYLQA